jgi:hypothetical protein
MAAGGYVDPMQAKWNAQTQQMIQQRQQAAQAAQNWRNQQVRDQQAMSAARAAQQERSNQIAIQRGTDPRAGHYISPAIQYIEDEQAQIARERAAYTQGAQTGVQKDVTQRAGMSGLDAQQKAADTMHQLNSAAMGGGPQQPHPPQTTKPQQPSWMNSSGQFNGYANSMNANSNFMFDSQRNPYLGK